MSKSFTIRLTYRHPPIPYRGSDWWAGLEGWEPGEPYGEGETLLAALGDLLANLEDRKCTCSVEGRNEGGHTDECAWHRWAVKGLEPEKPSNEEVA